MLPPQNYRLNLQRLFEELQIVETIKCRSAGNAEIIRLFCAGLPGQETVDDK
jgi:hypothetical protein